MDDDDDVEWGEDTSDAAVAQRMKDLSDAAKNLAISEDIEKTPQERIDIFYSYVKVLKKKLEKMLVTFYPTKFVNCADSIKF